MFVCLFVQVLMCVCVCIFSYRLWKPSIIVVFPVLFLPQAGFTKHWTRKSSSSTKTSESIVVDKVGVAEVSNKVGGAEVSDKVGGNRGLLFNVMI